MAVSIPKPISISIAEFRNRICAYIRMVEQGTTIHILKRYKPVAVINAEKFAMPNKNKKRIPGLLKNTVTILGDITGPVLDKEEWGSLWLDDSKD